MVDGGVVDGGVVDGGVVDGGVVDGGVVDGGVVDGGVVDGGVVDGGGANGIKRALMARGCLKVNLQIVQGNSAVAAFYQTLGYRVEERISMGKLLNKPGGES